MHIITRIAGVAAVPADSYTMPIAYAVGSIFVGSILILCVICHRRLRGRSRNMPINELPPQRIVDDRRHCYNHHDLLCHQHQNHASMHGFNQYQLEPSPSSESDEGEAEELEPDCDQETSSPDSV